MRLTWSVDCPTTTDLDLVNHEVGADENLSSRKKSLLGMFYGPTHPTLAVK